MSLLLTPHLKQRNLLLSALSREEHERLLPYLERVQLGRGKVLYEPEETIRHVYFPMSGLISILSITSAGDTIEIAMISTEGVAGVSVALGNSLSPYRVMVQIPAAALRVRTDYLQREFARSSRLREVMLRYTHALLVQISHSATCHRFHTVEERLCRWLLVTRDRVQADEFNLTQEFLSHMLGVPRTSITTIAGKLQRMGFIDYTRGKIRITDLRGLEGASCECYRNFTQVLGHLLVA